MPFGFLNAPAHFQSILEQILREDKPLSTAVYYNDLTPHRDSIEAVWEDTIATVAKLAQYGFMINLGKSKFIVDTISLLGY